MGANILGTVPCHLSIACATLYSLRAIIITKIFSRATLTSEYIFQFAVTCKI
jgi:hypothetical protein